MKGSLRAHLLLWLLLPLAVVLAINLADAYYRATETATLVTDRLLLASARVIAEQVRDVDGHIDAASPPAAGERRAAPDADKGIYQVVAPGGELVAGYPDLPAPNASMQEGYDALFRREKVRALMLQQPVVAHAHPAAVIVGTTLHARDAMRAELWLKAVRDQLLIVVAATGLTLCGLWRGLAPVRRLGRDVLARDARSREPVALGQVQTELRPLLAALNHALERVGQHIALQRRFIANAAHQLRTPLAVLKTQAAVGLRDPAPQAKDEALAAMEASANGLARVVNQLLTLARAEPGGANMRSVLDAAAPTRAALEQLAVLALDRGIDLTLHVGEHPIPVEAHVTLLHELVMNLVGNALDAAPRGGAVEVRLRASAGAAEWTIEDTGPGIPADQRARVMERFYRLPGAPTGGTGLGLAIVAAIPWISTGFL